MEARPKEESMNFRVVIAGIVLALIALSAMPMLADPPSWLTAQPPTQAPQTVCWAPPASFSQCWDCCEGALSQCEMICDPTVPGFFACQRLCSSQNRSCTGACQKQTP